MSANMEWILEDNGRFTLMEGALPVFTAYAKAGDMQGRTIDTRTAVFLSSERNGSLIRASWQSPDGLVLTEELAVTGDGATAVCILSDASGNDVETNDLLPLIMCAKSSESPYMWQGLQAKMMLFPFDNDMWTRYEAVSFLPGRMSADLTVLFDETTREGILIGATDFGVWKNAVGCSGFDCRTLEARCGRRASGDLTHDLKPHGTIIGKEVASSAFLILHGPDYRDLLEHFGDVLNRLRPIRKWEGGVPFGYNTYAALGIQLTEEKYRRCGTFIRENLMDNGFANRGTTYINLDGGWRDFDREAMLRVKDEYLARGQRVGIYDSPFAYWGGDLQAEIPYLDDHHVFEEIVVRDENGKPLPPLDTAYAYDVTHPVWQEWTRRKAQFYLDWGFTYLKVDFMSHAGVEGFRYDKSVRTGRQAQEIGYSFFEGLYTREKTGGDFFISLSISPLFPGGYGNSRRFSCDCFGLSEDIEYALNAQTFCWWAGGRIYQYNDSDHVVLHKAFTMYRESRFEEARARYTTAAIAGSVLLLSDDYACETARERAKILTANREVNHVAASGVAFRPVETAGGSAGHVYTGRVDGVWYAALFNWNEGAFTASTTCERSGLPEGRYRDLWTGKEIETENGVLTWDFTGTDGVLLKKI